MTCPAAATKEGYIYNFHVNKTWELDEQNCKSLPVRQPRQSVHEFATFHGKTPQFVQLEDTCVDKMPPPLRQNFPMIDKNAKKRNDELILGNNSELLERIEQNLLNIVTHFNKERVRHEKRNEWMRIGQRLNRFVMCLFVTINVIVSTIILAKLTGKV